MRIGAFQFEEPLPQLHEPHVFAVLQPWIDVGSAGSSTIALLERSFQAQPLARLSRPGNFYDFTRYRPLIRLVEGKRQVAIPNTIVYCAQRPEANDLLFFHLLEPHVLGETYVASVLRVMQELGVKRYCLIGGMYDAMPHTKPLIVTGIAAGGAEEMLAELGAEPSDYEGPTTIAIMISQEAASSFGIEAMTLIVHLPQYAPLEENFAGQLRLLEMLNSLYNFPIGLEPLKRQAEEQQAKLNLAMEKEHHLREVVRHLEAYYESRNKPEEDKASLPPEIESFLRDIDKRFGKN